MSEQIMCISRELFNLLDIKHGFTSGDKKLTAVLHLIKEYCCFKNRDEVEHDYNFVQIVTYTIVKCNERILNYSRGNKNGESRIHNKLSIGIGGHVNIDDGRSILRGAQRELQEEIGSEFGSIYLTGLLYEDNTDVGKVHLGVVYRTTADGDDLLKDISNGVETELLELNFKQFDELMENFHDCEGWSQLLLLNCDYL